MAHGEIPASARTLQCAVVTPEATVLETTAKFIALPLFDGEIGIAPLHSPLIGRLGYGEMRIISGGKTVSYYVDGGFVQVNGDVVAVLTNRAVPAEQVDEDAAASQLAAALQRPAPSEELIAIRDRQLAQSRAQLRIARRVKGAH